MRAKPKSAAAMAVVTAAALTSAILACSSEPYAAVAATESVPEVPVAESSTGELVRGIDVSHYSGPVEWETVAASGATFAVVKATEGVDALDPLFHDHWPKVRGVGLVRGAYHLYVTEDDPEQQAAFFLDTVSFSPGDLVPVVDLELIGHGTEPGLAGRVQVFLDLVERRVGAKPMIYTAPNFWDRNMPPDFGGYPLWIAETGVDAPTVPAGWSEWHIWQFRQDAAVDGVAKGADLSRVNAAGADLSTLRIPE